MTYQQHENSARYARDLPPMSPRQEWVVRSLALIALAYGIYWLWWRWTQTLNPDAMVFSIVLVSAETWGWIGSAFFLFHTWKVSDREAQPAPPGDAVSGQLLVVIEQGSYDPPYPTVPVGTTVTWVNRDREQQGRER